MTINRVDTTTNLDSQYVSLHAFLIMGEKLVKYGISAQDGHQKELELMIELEAIRRGGNWVDKKLGPQGLGLFDHFMKARKLLWPKRWRHRWVDLIYQEIINNMVTILMGSMSSGKTSLGCEYCLIDYWANPNNTLVLMSTTSVDKLKSAVFGEVSMLWSEGKKRFPWLAGNLLDHKNAITTDKLDPADKDEDEVFIRDMRRGVVGKACVPTGTLIDTPTGQKPIESLKEGDRVINAFGIGTIKETMSRISERLIRITLIDGRQIDCTDNHPVLTQRGWIKSLELTTRDMVFSAYETMSMLQETNRRRISKPEVLLEALPIKKTPNSMQGVWCSFPPMEKGGGRFLLNSMFWEMGGKASLPLFEKYEMSGVFQTVNEGPHEHPFLLRALPAKINRTEMPTVRESVHVPPYSLESKTICFLQSVLFSEREGIPSTFRSSDANKRGINGSFSFSKRSLELSLKDKFSGNRSKETMVQNRCSFSGNSSGGRGGWWSPQTANGSRSRQKESGSIAGTRVESVKILKQTGDPRFNVGEGGYRVHNLEVSGHPSYSVNGILVHNCFSGAQFVGLGVYQGIKQERIRFLADELSLMAPTFFDCLPNMIGSVDLDKNNQPQIKIIGSGNPKHDPFDQLGIAAEPDAGWESVGFIEKTTCWNTKFHRGRCVNLIGTDSPNFDVAPDAKVPFPRLVNRHTIEAVEKRWDRSSLKFNEQCVGRMMLGFTGDRVITRDLCKNNGASTRATWKDNTRTRIGAVDPAWTSSGDRCVWAWGEFGDSNDGKQIFRYGGHCIIPLVGGTQNEPDDQIAVFVKKQAAALNIPSINIFYGSTGRGTTGAAFAKIYGDQPPVPISEGGICSIRPVRHDLYVEENGIKRHKRCDEEYSKFITEIWFAVRNLIECGQMRELPEEVILEGCARQYTTVKSSKIEVESKDEMKETLGYSPDLFDTLGFLIEGARQRGFKIRRLGEDIIDITKHDDWLSRHQDKYREAVRSSRMSYD